MRALQFKVILFITFYVNKKKGGKKKKEYSSASDSSLLMLFSYHKRIQWPPREMIFL